MAADTTGTRRASAALSVLRRVTDTFQPTTTRPSVTKLAHDLGLQVTAEGVETAAQHDIVDALGCDLVQGYLYARPMPAAATGSLLASRKALPTR